jgi:hypothetical protein
MPSVDFCNVRDPRARPPLRQTPPHLRWQATARRAAPPSRRKVTRAGLPQLRGLRLPKALRPPPRRPHADVDLPQPVWSGHLLSPANTLHGLESALKSDRSEVGPPQRGNQRARPFEREPVEPFRAASRRRSRKRRRSTAPEVPSTSSPDSCEPGVTAGQPWSSRDWSAAHETFATSADPTLDEVASDWLSRNEHGAPFRARRPRLRLQSPEGFCVWKDSLA